MPAIICPHCGVTNRAFSNFCNNCGADLRDEAIDPEERTFDPHGDPNDGSLSDGESGPRLRQDRESRDASTEIEPGGSTNDGEDAEQDTADAQSSPSVPLDQTDYFERFDDPPPDPQQSDDGALSASSLAASSLAASSLAASSRAARSTDDGVEPAETPDADLPRNEAAATDNPLAYGVDSSLGDGYADTPTDAEQPEVDDHPVRPESAQLIAPDEQDDTQTSEHVISDRLVSEISGALHPHELVHALFAEDLQPGRGSDEGGHIQEEILHAKPRRPIPTLDSVDQEDIRATMGMDAILENELLPVGPPRSESLRLPAIFLLMLGVLLLALGLNFTRPGGTVEPLVGVGEALTVIESLPQNANVLVLWAYDPATAGEMDLIVQPVLQHLIDKEAQLSVVSTLPMGPATARRLWLNVTEQYTSINRAGLIDLGYLPGGASSMPLLAYTEVLGILRYGVREFGAGSTLVNFWQGPPDLMLVVAAQAEDVQLWLEQVQPLNDIPTVGITAAAVDPIARPYWNSGQLAGLISGFDGAIDYQNRIVERLTLAQQADQTFLLSTVDTQTRHLIAQNWGHILLLLLILLGNLSFLAGRRNRS